MTACPRTIARAALALATTLVLALPALALPWRPITPEDLAAGPRLDPETGIEVMFREVRIDDTEYDRTVFENYIRLKVFNDRGVAALDKVELFESRDFQVRGIRARVIRPDGTIVPVESGSVFTREVLRRGSIKLRARSFTFPALEPGCIVEYQWEEAALDEAGGLYGVTLRFHDRYPTWHVRYRLKPSPDISPAYNLHTAARGVPISKPKRDRDDYYTFEMFDQPAIPDEPWMPPEDNVQAWMVLYYLKTRSGAADYWKERAADAASYVDKRTKPDKAIEALAQELGAGAEDDMARLRRFYEYCLTRIVNVSSDVSGMTPEQIAAMKDNRSAAQAIARGAGTAFDVNLAFMALARAAGMHVRVARVGDRSERFFDPGVPVRAMLPDFVVAVRLDGVWKFFDPGSRYIPFGSLSWRNENTKALICDQKKHEFVDTGATPGTESSVVRRANLELDAEGTLSGRVVLEFTGQFQAIRKSEFDSETAESAARIVRAMVHERLGTAEVSDVEVSNASDPIKPMMITYTVRVPDYAERTGRRLMFAPSFFEKGNDPVFKTEKRAHDIYFNHAFMEEDVVDIRLPEGFEFEQASAPPSVADGPAMRHIAKIGVTRSGARMIYQRGLVVQGILYGVDHYPEIKRFHDAVHASDHHVLVLRRREDAAAEASPVNAP